MGNDGGLGQTGNMQITHLGHSCVLLETAGQRILVDPGDFSTAWRGHRTRPFPAQTKTPSRMSDNL